VPPEPGALAGAAEAVTALYEAHALGLIRLAVVMLGDRPAAEDVVQEAFYGAGASADGSVAALLRRGAETEFIGYSAATGKVARVLGHWTFGSVGALSVEVLWSNASGSVLIGVIPDGGGGRVGVISGNEFTPLPLSGAASAPMQSGTW
jgi:hypothetical protein